MRIFYSDTYIDISVDDASCLVQEYGVEHYLELVFSLSAPLMLPVGAYTDFENVRYYLMMDEEFTMNNAENYEYTLYMRTDAYRTTMYKMRNPIDGRIAFSYTATPQEHVQMVVDNMNMRDSGWSVGDCIESSEKVVSYSYNYLNECLDMIATAFETEFEIIGKVVHLRKVGYNESSPLVIEFGKGKGVLPPVTRENSEDGSPIEILYAQGGSENIDASSYGSPILLLPISQTIKYDGTYFEDEEDFDEDSAYEYTTSEDGFSIQRADKDLSTYKEDALDCTHISPKRVGVVTDVETIENGDGVPFVDIIDSTIPDNLDFSDYRIGGETPSIQFQSGMLSGKTFDIENTEDDFTGYKHSERRFKIVQQEIDGIVMPNPNEYDGAYMPEEGDKYAIFGVTLPDAYICDDDTKSGASWDVFRECVRYLYTHGKATYNYSGTIDKRWAKTDWLNKGGKLIFGGYVKYVHPQYHPNGEKLRLNSIKRYLNNPYAPEISFSNSEMKAGSYASLKTSVKSNETKVNTAVSDLRGYTKRSYADAKQTAQLLVNAALSGFDEGISPLFVNTMQLLIGDKSLQFVFVDEKETPAQISHIEYFDTTDKKFKCDEGIIQHKTLGVTTVSNTHAADEYLYWDVPEYSSAVLSDPDKTYYVYIKASKTSESGEFILSETGIALESVDGYYHLLVGILNSEIEGDRSYAPMYGFSLLEPGRLIIDLIKSGNFSLEPFSGMQIDLANNRIFMGGDAAIVTNSLKVSRPGSTELLDIEGKDGATIIPVYKLGEAQPEIPADAVSELPEGWSFEMPEYNYTTLTYEGWGEDWTSTERGVFEYNYNNEPWREAMSLFSYLEITVDASKDFDLTIQNTGEEGAALYLVLSSISFENMTEMQDYVLGAITAGNEYVVPRTKGISSVYLAAIGSGSTSGSIALQGLLDEPVTEIKGAEVTYTTSVEYNTNNFTQASSEGGTITYDYVGAAMGDDWGGYLRLEFDSPEAFELTIENTSYASAGTVARFNVQSINTEPYASTDIMVVLSPTDENSAMVSIPKGESFLSVIATEPTTARASEGSLQLSGIPATTQLDHVYDPSVWVSMVSLKDEQYYFRAPYKPKGDEGKQGVSAAPYSYRGEWSASNTYCNNDACRDAVRYGDLFYRYVGIDATQSDTFNEIDWDAFVGNFENIATGLLLAQEAFIDNLGVGRVKTINEDGNTVVDISNTLAKFGDFNVNPATGDVNIKDESGDVKVTMSRKAVSTAFNPQVEILDDINYATNFITPVKISDDIVIDSNTAIAVSGSLYASATSGMLTVSGTNSSIETTTTVTLYLYKDNALVEEIASTDVVADWYESIEVTGVRTATNQEAYNYQSSVLAAGTYDIRAKVMKSTGLYILESVIHPPQSSGKVLDTKITTLDGLGQLVIAPNTLTMLLNATNYGAIYIKDGELNFDFKGDSWKSSGALCSARIDVSAKSIVKQWGGAGVFDRVTYSSTSGYYLYHNLGHSNYIANCTPYGSTTSSVKVMYEGADYVRVMADGDFNITMIGKY